MTNEEIKSIINDKITTFLDPAFLTPTLYKLLIGFNTFRNNYSFEKNYYSTPIKKLMEIDDKNFTNR